MPATTFNSEQFSWSSVTIQVGNRVLIGVQGVSYDMDQEKGFVYGKGNQPMSIQRGNYSYAGSIRVLQSELEILIAGAPDSDMNKYRNLTVTVAYEKEDNTVIVDNLVGVEFNKVSKAIDQGKLQMEVDLPILFLGIQYNV